MKITPRLLVICALFITCIITANTIVVKFSSFFGQILPAAVVLFPVSYIFGDILTEVYGYKTARRVIWLGFLCNLVFVFFVWVAQMLPLAPPAWVADDQSAYERVLGHTPQVLFASFVAYLMGEFSNSFVLAKMKIATSGRWLWTRTIGSTVIGQGLDSVVFLSLLAVFGVIPNAILLTVVVNHWLFKTGFEVLATPFTYGIVNYLKRKEGIDTYDRKTNFNPVLLTE